MQLEDDDTDVLLSRVHNCAEDKIIGFVENLDVWKPFIPNTVRNDGIFNRRSYTVTRTFRKGTLSIGFRIYKVISHPQIEDLDELLTICVYSKENSVVVKVLSIYPPENGFTRWAQFSSEGMGQASEVETRRIEYDDPKADESGYSNKEILDILDDVIGVVNDLRNKYRDMGFIEIKESSVLI